MCAATSDKQAFAGGEAPSGDSTALQPGSSNWGTGGCDLFLKSISKFFVSRCISVSSPSGGGAARPSPPRAETPQRAAGEGDVAGRG